MIIRLGGGPVGALRRAIGAIACVLVLVGPQAAMAKTEARVVAKGFSLLPPADWTVEEGLLGAAVTARPSQQGDPMGWANDLLNVTVEPYDARRTCLDGFVLRKLKDMGHLATTFKVVDEQAQVLGKAQATFLELRYVEGPVERSAYVMIMASKGRMVTATLASSPARFEFNRARFRDAVESLRPR